MLYYNYLQNLTLEQLNELGQEGWEITGLVINSASSTFDVFLTKGFQEKTLIENAETNAKFWVDESFSYGEGTLIIFLTIFMFCIIGKIVYNFLFKEDA